MNKTSLLLIATVATLGGQTAPKLSYPAAPKVNQVDDYSGVKISDPYRTLENADAPATQKWVEQENKLTFGYLAKLPGRAAIHSRLTDLWNYEKFGNMFKAGSHYFYSHNTGLQNQNVVYVMDSLDGEPRVLLDPNTYRADGTAALSGVSVSWDGNLFGYGLAQAGSDWTEWRVRDVRTGKDLPDLIQWTKGADLAWTADNKALYYGRYPEPPANELLTVAAKNERIYFHKLGTLQAQDKLIYERPKDPTWILGPGTTEDGRYLFIWISPGDVGKNLLSYIDLKSSDQRIVNLITEAKFRYSPIESDGSIVYIDTTDSASLGRIIAVDLTNSDRSHWREVVPEQKETLNSVQLAGGKLALSYMKDAHSIARLVALDGTTSEDIALPGVGTMVWSQTHKSDRELFYLFTSYTAPPQIYHFDLHGSKSSLVHESHVKFNPDEYETKQVFYNSKDGTRVPMFLNYRKGLRLNGQNPTLLYGYGGFDIAITPSFNPALLQWMEMGGVYAVANLRGGSEYGEEWHLAGTKQQKQHVFDDFISAAEWLIANQYTSTPKLAIFGASNGGLLVGAVLNQRPDLFGAAMPAVGVMDMLRFHKFTFGAEWVGDFGSPDVPDDFKAIRAYSPLHNIHAGVQYPATLITTSDHDDRVVPGHSFKYAATLQAAQEGPAPILIRIETRAGHGAGKPTTKVIDEWTDRFTFLASALKMSIPEARTQSSAGSR